MEGNRANWGPGIVWAAAEGKPELPGGEVGVPEAEVPPADLSFAEADGIGRKAWPGLGFAVSSGGALNTFFGMLVTAVELITSVYVSY